MFLIFWLSKIYALNTTDLEVGIIVKNKTLFLLNKVLFFIK